MGAKTTQMAAKQGAALAPSHTPAPRGLIQRSCACGGHAGLDGQCEDCRHRRLAGERRPPIQTKLAVNRPGDRYEQEADRVADQVMRMPKPSVQRSALPEGDEENERLQLKPLADQITPLVQREALPEEDEDEEEEALQAKATATPALTTAGEASIQAVRQGGGQPLDPATRAFMEPRLGHDFGRVRVHAGPRAAEAARSVGARAFTVGRDVAFGTGQYAPGTAEGRRLLAHELVHTVQQGASGSRLVQRAPVVDLGTPEQSLRPPPVKDQIRPGGMLAKRLHQLDVGMTRLLINVFGEPGTEAEESWAGLVFSAGQLSTARRAAASYVKVTAELARRGLDLAFAAQWLDILNKTLITLRSLLKKVARSETVDALMAKTLDRQASRLLTSARKLQGANDLERGRDQGAEARASVIQGAEGNFAAALEEIAAKTQLRAQGMSDLEIDLEIEKLRLQSRYEVNPARKQVIDAMIAGLESGKVAERPRGETTVVEIEDKVVTAEVALSNSRETSANILRRMDVSDLSRLAETPEGRLRLGRIGLELAEATSFQTAGAVAGALLPADVSNIVTERWEEERAVEKLSRAVALSGKAQRVIEVSDEVTGLLRVRRSDNHVLVEKSVYLGGAPESFEPSELVTIRSVITGKSTTLPAFGLLYLKDKELVDTYATWAALAELGVSAAGRAAKAGSELLEETGEATARQVTRRGPSPDLAARVAQTSERRSADLSPQELVDEILAVQANPTRPQRGKYTWTQGKDGRWCRSNPTCFQVVEHADGTVSLRPIQRGITGTGDTSTLASAEVLQRIDAAIASGDSGKTKNGMIAKQLLERGYHLEKFENVIYDKVNGRTRPIGETDIELPHCIIETKSSERGLKGRTRKRGKGKTAQEKSRQYTRDERLNPQHKVVIFLAEGADSRSKAAMSVSEAGSSIVVTSIEELLQVVEAIEGAAPKLARPK
ncbi:MAG: DUF4157 domain-containing protein [Chloroflexales bacterium]|nr:DUF4157 domain-containing protein [Chloroflexales bacterium]